MEQLPVGEIERIATIHGVLSVRVFGSRARGEARADSDLDLLISPGPQMSLLDMIAFQHALEDLLSIEVDVVSDRALHPLLRETILAEAKPLHAA